MPNYAKNERKYSKVEFDERSVKSAYAKRKKAKKFPTSISLPEDIVAQLKAIAQKKGLPYQTLMRMLIIEGLDNLKKSA
jgi:predicted DNA binding CopG/RHH family protein